MERALLGLICLIGSANFLPTVVSPAQDIIFQTEQQILHVFQKSEKQRTISEIKANIGAKN
jgi:hypothetical protein